MTRAEQGQMMRDRIAVILIAMGVLVADQVSKAVLVAWLPLHARYEIIEGFVTINHVQNPGAAFGLFAEASGGVMRWALVVVSVAAVGLIWAYAREGWHQTRTVVAFGAILGGALGNLVDRIRLGYVVDFIDLHVGSYHWPSFNLADSAITLGALTLFIALARQGAAERRGQLRAAPARTAEKPAKAVDDPAESA